MAMSEKAKVFCGYFNTCRANLDGMEDWLDRHPDKLSASDKTAIARQMSADSILLPRGDDSQERWDSIVVAMGAKSSLGLK